MNTVELRNGLIFFASATESAKAHLHFTFCSQIPHKLHNIMILLQNKTKFGLMGIKGLAYTQMQLQIQVSLSHEP